MFDIVIIGAGPVGLYGATLASLHNLKGIIVDSLDNVGGQLTSLYPEKDMVDLPGFKNIKAKDYIKNLYDQYNEKDNKLDLHLNEIILSIEEVDDGLLLKSNKGEYLTKTVVVVSGMGQFSPRKIGLVNEDKLNGIMYSTSNIEDFINKDVTILGGGDSAVDLALMLEKKAKSINIVHRRDEFRAQSNSVSKMEESSVNIYKNYSVVSASNLDNGTSLKIKHNVEDKEVELKQDILLVQYGQVSSKDNFPLEKKDNFIIIHDYYETSMKNVFAAGNIINYPGKVKNVTTGLGEISVIITKIDQIINPNKNIPAHF